VPLSIKSTDCRVLKSFLVIGKHFRVSLYAQKNTDKSKETPCGYPFMPKNMGKLKKGNSNLREQFGYIKQGHEIRKNLISVKEELKRPEGRRELRKLFLEEPKVLLSLLDEADPKIRKNAALVLGNVGTEECREAILKAYRMEEKRFVKSAYPEALAGCDCSGCIKELKSRRKELLDEIPTIETQKHQQEELRALNTLLSFYEKAKGHKFMGFSEPSDVILITHPDYRQVTLKNITEGQTVLIKAGVKVLGGNLENLLKIRTFRELLFCLNIAGELKADTASEQLASSNLLSLLKELHHGEGAFYFRIECKGRMTLEQRSSFTKKLAARLEILTGGRLINSTSNYEAELRLVETKKGGFYPLLKLYTLPDRRFAYRKNAVSASIRPERAALCMELAADYLKENARVLDPFCGVGTMLVERNYRVHADTLYGVDIYEPAIAGARGNTEIARMTAHYIHRDFQDFTHEYLFDEIVTNFPAKGKNLNGHTLEFLYGKFFDRVGELLRPGGFVLLYSHDRAFVNRQMMNHGSLKLLEEWPMGGKEESWLFAIRFSTVA